MPVPKKRQSKSKSNIRKANWKKGILNQKKTAITKGKEEKKKFLNKIPQKTTMGFDSKQLKQDTFITNNKQTSLESGVTNFTE